MKAGNILGDIPKEKMKMAEITSKWGYLLYQKTAKKFPKDTDEDFSKIVSSLEAAFTYLMANEVMEDKLDFFVNSVYEHLKLSVQRIKNYKSLPKEKEEKEYLFSEELRNRMSKFNGSSVQDCLKDPSFFDELLNHAGMTEDQKKKLWTDIGRPDIADAY